MTRRIARGAGWVLGLLLGLALFVVALRAVDARAVVAGVQRIGPGFLVLVLIAGVRLMARAGAWSACAGTESRLPFSSTLGACIVGEALGNVTPLGLVASEPAKVLWVRRHLSSIEASALLAVETLIYSATVAMMLVAGAVTAVVMAAVKPGARLIASGVIAGGVAIGLLLVWVLARPRTWHATRAWLGARAARRPWLGAVAEALRRMQDLWSGLASRRPRTLMAVTALELVFQALAVVEVYVTLVLLGAPHVTLVQAFLLEFANRVVTVAFKFVPFRLGVDEVASAIMSGLLGGAASAGVIVAVIRKARVLFWSLVGLLLLAGRAWSERRSRWNRVGNGCLPLPGTTSD